MITQFPNPNPQNPAPMLPSASHPVLRQQFFRWRSRSGWAGGFLLERRTVKWIGEETLWEGGRRWEGGVSGWARRHCGVEDLGLGRVRGDGFVLVRSLIIKISLLDIIKYIQNKYKY